MLFQDERLSTAAVTRGMIDDYDMSRAKRAERVDAAAAAWILESALPRLGWNLASLLPVRLDRMPICMHFFGSESQGLTPLPPAATARAPPLLLGQRLIF